MSINPKATRGFRHRNPGNVEHVAAISWQGLAERPAGMYSLIVTAKLNDIDPRARLTDVMVRIADHPASRLHELLPWAWKNEQAQLAAAT